MIAKQIIKDSNKNYLIPIDSNYFNLAIEDQSFTIDDINFNIDYNVTTYTYLENDNGFDMNKTYLISFSVLQKKYEQNIVLKLIDSKWALKDSLKNEQNINYVALNIPVMEDENNPLSYSFSFVFKPNSKNFNKIIFQSLGNYEIQELEENRIVDLTDISIQEVNTDAIISDSEELKNIKEFGIQAPPGFLFTINGEGFHIGRTGMFYLAENDFIFESIGICNNTLPFIIDYKVEG